MSRQPAVLRARFPIARSASGLGHWRERYDRKVGKREPRPGIIGVDRPRIFAHRVKRRGNWRNKEGGLEPGQLRGQLGAKNNLVGRE